MSRRSADQRGRGVGIELIVVTLATALAGAVSAGTKSWDGGAGTSSWHNGENWNPDGVPLLLDDVVIDCPGSITVSFDAGSTTINSLTCAEHLVLIGGTLSPQLASQISGSLTIGAGTLSGSGDVSITGTLTWDAGTMTGSGRTILAPGSTAALSAASTRTLSRTLENHGTIGFSAGGFNIDSVTGVLNNMSDGTIAMSGSTGISGSGGGTVNNAGTISKSGGSSVSISNVVLSNSGSLKVNSGTVWLTSAVPQFDAATNTLTGGTWLVGQGATLHLGDVPTIRTIGPGTTVILNSPISWFPALNGLTTISSGATLELAGGRDFSAVPLGGIFFNNGMLTLGSQSEFAVSGIAVQNSTGVLHTAFESAGGLPRLMAVTGVMLNGGVVLSFVGGFTPALGQTIPIASTLGGSVTGAFATVVHPMSRSCTIALMYTPSLVGFGLETVAPNAVCKDIAITLDESGNASITAEQLDGGSSDNCALASLSISKDTFTCADVGALMVTLTATDSAGNTGNCDALVTIEPTGSFLGSSGGSWMFAGNWCMGVPALVSDVTISTGVVIDSPGAFAQNVFIESGGSLTIGSPTGAWLQVLETLTVGTGGTLSLQANASVTAQTLVVEAGGTLNLTDALALLSVTDLLLLPGSMLNWQTGAIEISGTMSSNENLAIGCAALPAVLRLLGGQVVTPELLICADGVLMGHGVVISSALNKGVVSPGLSTGAIVIDGDFVQGDSGTLAIQIGGTQPVLGSDILIVNGSATLGGLLHVSLEDGFESLWGDAFQIVSSALLHGEFVTIDLPRLSSPLYLVTESTESALTIVVRRLYDLNNDDAVNGADLGLLLSMWGPCANCAADFNGNGKVDGVDLGLLMANWAP